MMFFVMIDLFFEVKYRAKEKLLLRRTQQR